MAFDRQQLLHLLIEQLKLFKNKEINLLSLRRMPKPFLALLTNESLNVDGEGIAVKLQLLAGGLIEAIVLKAGVNTATSQEKGNPNLRSFNRQHILQLDENFICYFVVAGRNLNAVSRL
jgi:hypothetical protein